jgi:hypothetical protein
MKIEKLLAGAACAVVFGGAASAVPITYDFATLPSANNLDSITYTVSGVNLTANGYNTSGDTPTGLWTKGPGNGPDEDGLGTAIDTPDYEITSDQFVQLNVSDLLAKGYNSLTIYLGSLQQGEQGLISYGSVGASLTNPSVATLTGTPVTQSFTLSLTPGKDYIDITGGGPNSGSEESGDIVIESATANSVRVPDGGETLTLVGAAVAALAALRRRCVV